MSRQRRQDQRRQRQRQRRQGRAPGYEPAGAVQFPGVFGFLQRHTRLFFVGGILVMIASLGAIFFPASPHAVTPDEVATDEQATASATPSAEATAESTAEAIVRSYSSPPAPQIDPAKEYEAVIRTDSGEVRIALLPDVAEGYVNNFVFLAQNRFYDGLTFHRVVPGFVAQAGDPSGSGFGGPGYALPEERNDLPFEAGVLSMAKAGATVNGSQFFITLDDEPTLNEDFTVFGRVIAGLDVLRALEARDPADTEAAAITILGIDIIERG